MTKVIPLKFDYANSLIPDYGISEEMIQGISEPLIAAQQEVLRTDLELMEQRQERASRKATLGRWVS